MVEHHTMSVCGSGGARAGECAPTWPQREKCWRALLAGPGGVTDSLCRHLTVTHFPRRPDLRRYFAPMHPFFLFNGRRRGGSAARCDALLKTFPRDAAASFSAQVLHSRPRRHAEFHDGDRLNFFQKSPHKVDLVPREGTPRERVRKPRQSPRYSFGTKSPKTRRYGLGLVRTKSVTSRFWAHRPKRVPDCRGFFEMERPASAER